MKQSQSIDRSLTDDLNDENVDPFENPSVTGYLLERLGIASTDRLSLFSDSVLPKPKETEMREFLRKGMLTIFLFHLFFLLWRKLQHSLKMLYFEHKKRNHESLPSDQLAVESNSSKKGNVRMP